LIRFVRIPHLCDVQYAVGSIYRMKMKCLIVITGHTVISEL